MPKTPSAASHANASSGSSRSGFASPTPDRAIESLPLAQLRPWPRNARTHSKKQIRQIADSIERFGFTNPVLIDGDNQILAGHGRVEAAKLIGTRDGALSSHRPYVGGGEAGLCAGRQ